MCRTTTPTASDGNECGDDKEAKTAYQTTENEMVEPREGRVLPKAQEILAFVTPKMNYEELEADQLWLAKEELGDTSGGGQFLEKETWWWNQWVRKPQRLRQIPLRSGNTAERNKIVSSIKSRKKGA